MMFGDASHARLREPAGVAMPMTFSCPECNARLKVGDQFAGCKVQCPKCGGVIAAPADRDQNPLVRVPRKGNRGLLIGLLTAGGVLAIGAIVLFMILSAGKDDPQKEGQDLPAWEPDAKLLDALGPPTDVVGYQIRVPKDYTVFPTPEGAPPGGQAFFWGGPLRKNGTRPVL